MEIPEAAVVEVHPGCVDRGPRHLGPHQHVGQQVLDRLEGPDGSLELLALLGVGHGHVDDRPGHAEEQGGGQGRALEPPLVRRLRACDPGARR